MQMICILWLTSCTATHIRTSNPAPRIYPPDPYDESGAVVWEYDAERDVVTVPYWYWEKVFDYIADTQAVQEIK